MKSINNIALRLKDWTEDIQAQQGLKPLLISKTLAGSGGVIIVLAVLLGFSGNLLNLPSWFANITPILFVTGFVFVISATIFHKKAKNSCLLCTRCGKQMVYTEYEYPNNSPQLSRFKEVIEGNNDRVYVLYTASSGRGGTHPAAARLKQGIRICRNCKRYVLIDEMILKDIGTTKSDIMAAERKSKNIDSMKKKYANKHLKIANK